MNYFRKTILGFFILTVIEAPKLLADGDLPPHQLSRFHALALKVARSKPFDSHEIVEYTKAVFDPAIAAYLVSRLGSDLASLQPSERLPVAAAASSHAPTLVGSLIGTASSFENANNRFENFDEAHSIAAQNLRRIQEFARIPVGSGTKGSRGLYLQGPAGVGKTHLTTALAQDLKEQGLRVVFVRGDQLHEFLNKRCGLGMGYDKFFAEEFDAILIDDLNELNMFQKGFLRQLILWSFDHGTKKIVITSNMDYAHFMGNVFQNTTFRADKDGHLTVPSGQQATAESTRLVSRLNTMMETLDFSGIPSRR